MFLYIYDLITQDTTMQSKREREMWTKRREDRSVRDLKIFLSYHEQARNGGMPLGIVDALAEEFGVVRNTVYNIRRRMPRMLEEMEKRHPEFAKRISLYRSHPEPV